MIFNKRKKNFIHFFIILLFFLNSCSNGLKLPGGDARKNPPNAADRQAKRLEEGRGFRLNDMTKRGLGGGGNFEFASSNELWRASLDVIDFMPLASANYSGGMIITDWYSDGDNNNQSIKINIRFLTNEIRSDALDINVFYKICDESNTCTIKKNNSELKEELTKEILKRATIYQTQKKDENFRPYTPIKKNE
jgi:hypothetical protein